MGARSGGTGRTAKTSHTDENAKKVSQQLAADKKEQAKLEAKVKNSETMDYNAGFNAENETYDKVADYWNVKNNTDMGVRQAFKEFDLDKFGLNNYRQQIIDTAKKIGMPVVITECSVVMNRDTQKIRIVLKDANGDEIFRNIRYMEKQWNEKVAYQYLLEIDAEYQGKGFAQKIYRENLKSYMRMGVDKMTINANIDVGGYAWSKYGFNHYGGKSEVLEFISSEVSKNYKDKFVSVVNDYYKTHKQSEGFPMSKIGYTSWGKEALLGTSWGGELNLKDKRQVAIYESYLRSKEKKYENTESKK